MLSADLEVVELYVLYDSPHPVPKDVPLVYDTLASEMTIDRITPCALISNFTNASVYEIATIDRNVLLKYKDNGICSFRNGGSINRVGFFGWLQGKQFAKDKLDFSTNTTKIKCVLNTSKNNHK